MPAKVCHCGKGYVSRYDGKCGHCRTVKEQKLHVWKLYNDKYPAWIVFAGEF